MIKNLLLLSGVVFTCLAVPPAVAIDWSIVKAKEVAVFHPGQASWEWTLTQKKHSAAKNFRGGKNCIDCHGEEEQAIGDLIVSGEKVEPDPIDGKRGVIPVMVQVARDDGRLYARFEWQAVDPNQSRKMDSDYEARITFMFDDGSVKEATRAGCWGVCHDDAAGMASELEDLEKYLSRSRTKNTRTGGGKNFKPQVELEALLADGHFLEYWQARLNRSGPIGAIKGKILEARDEEEGTNLTAEGGFKDGKWVVVLSRDLVVGAAGSKDFAAGQVYTFGIAVHEGFANKRFHNVSFEHTLVLDSGEADFVAVKQ